MQVLPLNRAFGFVGCWLALGLVAQAAEVSPAAQAVNAFGVDLYQRVASQNGNVCLSPYSISTALAMTLTGAEGATRTEMARVMHAEKMADADASFAALAQAFAASVAETEKIAKEAKKHGGPSDPMTLTIANRLFPRAGFVLRPEFLERAKKFYQAPPEPLDFAGNAAAATQRINRWVEKETRERIRDLIPSPLDPATRLVLVNALYFKGPWQEEFSASATKPEGFHADGGAAVKVPTMRRLATFAYAARDGYEAVALPYSGGDWQFVILLPEANDGLPALEKKLSAEMLQACAQLPTAKIDLHLPKFKLEPPTIALAEELKALGMKSAFDVPPGSANFDRMAPQEKGDGLAISEVLHKTFLAVDEKGTEAAAATAVVMRPTSAMPEQSKPIEVKVDRPFLYAIQHVPSGACLFLGRVTDPR